MRKSHLVLSALLTSFLIGTSGCKGLEGAAGSHAAKSSGLASLQFHLSGIVLGKSPISGQVTIEQAAVPGTMPATMAIYTVLSSSAFQALEPGDEIEAEAFISGDDSMHLLKKITIASEPRSLKDLSALPPHPLLIGEAVPLIPMTNQDGHTVDLPDLHGKAVLITFVDTQCTDDCPIITRLFAGINNALAKDSATYAQSELITVSIDPVHDTPPILRKYGLKYMEGNAEGFAHWQFVDLTAANLKRLATSFSVIYMPSGDDIIHTVEICLISPDGTLLHTWDGDHWNPETIAKAVEAITKQTNPRKTKPTTM